MQGAIIASKMFLHILKNNTLENIEKIQKKTFSDDWCENENENSMDLEQHVILGY